MRLESQIERAQKMLDTLKKIYSNVKDNLSESMSEILTTNLSLLKRIKHSEVKA